MGDVPGELKWPSVPKALAAAFYTKFGAGSTQISYPLELPVIQVRRLGGGDDRVTDRARVDVLVIAEDEESAEDLSEAIRSFLVDTSPIRGAGLLLDGATTEVAPHWIAYGATGFENAVQYLATYVVESRRA